MSLHIVYLWFAAYLLAAFTTALKGSNQPVGGSLNMQTAAINVEAKAADKEDVELVKLCTAFGFDSKVGQDFFSQLFGSAILDREDIIVINTSETDDLVALGGGDIAVGFVDRIQLLANGNDILATVQAYVDGVFTQGDPSKLILFVEGERGPALDAVEQSIMHIIKDSHAPLAYGERDEATMIEITTIPVGFDPNSRTSAIDEAKTKLYDKIAALDTTTPTRARHARRFFEQQRGESPVSSGLPHQGAQPLQTVQHRGQQFGRSSQEFELEVEAAAACVEVSEDFSETLQSAVLSVLGPPGPIGASPQALPPGVSVNGTVQSLRAAIQSAVLAHASRHGVLFEQFGSSAAMAAAVFRARLELVSAVQSAYRAVTESVLRLMVELFDSQLQRVPGGTRLPVMLDELAQATIASFVRNLRSFQDEFLQIVTMQTEGGFLAPELTVACCSWLPSSSSSGGISAIGNPQSYTFSRAKTLFAANTAARRMSRLLRPQFDFSLEEHRLRRLVQQRVRDRVDALFLAGAYNPYVRDSPLPPTHINLNYYLDPRGLLLNREYNRLYDEQRAGPCEQRADPLRLPGVAAFPFDPNAHPIPSERDEPWWKLAYDFFTKD